MAQDPISDEDLDDLAGALDGLEQLTAAQRRLLAAVVWAAADTVRPSAATEHRSFQEQFRAAYTPGVAELLIERAGHITRG
ncbi:hypothetical protein [Jidongwangia harbinensis]|uniref:hypothetical protein n=1 Tax=Jidongwangia harbinensis TaxID=2878561 RepID=UPI001CD9C823|nr:hypothetical protein [Jidongwangia harbinensis]MCA2211925.1 hypothetical protein [Jidongwangia harbinensis]